MSLKDLRILFLYEFKLDIVQPQQVETSFLSLEKAMLVKGLSGGRLKNFSLES